MSFINRAKFNKRNYNLFANVAPGSGGGPPADTLPFFASDSIPNIFKTSLDGNTWTDGPNPPRGVGPIACGCNGSLGIITTTGPRVYTTPDAVVYTQQAITPISIQRAKYANGVWVGINFNAGPIVTSVDGKTWTARTNIGAVHDIAWCGDRWMATKGTPNAIYQSLDNGVNWTLVPTVFDYGCTNVDGLAYFGGAVFALGLNNLGVPFFNMAWRSVDKVNFTHTSNVSPADADISFRPAVSPTSIVALINNTENLYRTTDGLTWGIVTNSLPSAPGAMTSIVYRHGLYVAVYGAGDVYVSADDGATFVNQGVKAGSWNFVC